MSAGTELATMTPATPPVTFHEMQVMARNVAASGLFGGNKNESSVLTLMLLCQAEGLHPIQAMRRYHVIHGQPSMRADAMQAEFQRNGGRVHWVISDQGVCEANFIHAVHAPAPGFNVRLTMADAKQAGLTKNDLYQKYPAQMLRARVISQGVRAVLPGVVVGIYTPEEIEPLDVTGGEVAPVRASVVATGDAKASLPPAEMPSNRAAVNAEFGGQPEPARYPVKEKFDLPAQKINAKGLDSRPWANIPSDEAEAHNRWVAEKCRAEGLEPFEGVAGEQIANHLVTRVLNAEPSLDDRFVDIKEDGKRVRRGPGKLMAQLGELYSHEWRDWLRGELKRYLAEKRRDVTARIDREVYGDATPVEDAAESQEPATPPEDASQEVIEPELEPVGADRGGRIATAVRG